MCITLHNQLASWVCAVYTWSSRRILAVIDLASEVRGSAKSVKSTAAIGIDGLTMSSFQHQPSLLKRIAADSAIV